MKPIKLEPGEIWRKKGTLDVRTIDYEFGSNVFYFDIGGTKKMIAKSSFRHWIRRNKGSKNEVKLIGHYDLKTGKARVVK